MPANDLALLIDAAREAGAIARRYWRNRPDFWEKDQAAGPVSEADLAVNAMLEHDLRAARPDFGWLSEETADGPARLAAEQTFIVDPIDGTRAFLAGEPGFSHSLAIACNGQITAAVVYLPVHDLLYTAAFGSPALLNGAPLVPGTARSVEGATILTTGSTADPSHWRGPVPAYRRVFRPSLAWRLCLVAEGRFDAAVSLRPAWEWDIAAGSLIAAQAGVVATDQAGLPLAFNRPTPQSRGLIAAIPALHADLTERLRG